MKTLGVQTGTSEEIFTYRLQNTQERVLDIEYTIEK